MHINSPNSKRRNAKFYRRIRNHYMSHICTISILISIATVILFCEVVFLTIPQLQNEHFNGASESYLFLDKVYPPSSIAVYWNVPCTCCGFNIEAMQLLLGLRAVANKKGALRTQKGYKRNTYNSSSTIQVKNISHLDIPKGVSSDIRELPMRLRLAELEFNCWCEGASEEAILERMVRANRISGLSDELLLAIRHAQIAHNQSRVEILTKMLKSFSEHVDATDNGLNIWSPTDIVDPPENEFRIFVHHWGVDWVMGVYPLQRDIPIHSGVGTRGNNNPSYRNMANVLRTVINYQKNSVDEIQHKPPFKVLSPFDDRYIIFPNLAKVLKRHPHTMFDYFVSRSMYELDRFPSKWIEDMRARKPSAPYVDEIWVPAQFIVDSLCDSFAGDGYNSPPPSWNGTHAGVPIYVIPEAIDLALYDPKLHNVTSRKAPYEGLKNSKDRHDIKGPTNSMKNGGNDNGGNLSLKEPPYSFYSNFKLEERKGWQALLESYFRTFTSSDNVVLTIKTYLYFEKGDKIRDYHRGYGFIESFAKTLKGMPMLNTLWRCYNSTLHTYPHLQPFSERNPLYREGDFFSEPITPDQFARFSKHCRNMDASSGKRRAFCGIVGPDCEPQSTVDLSKLPRVILDLQDTALSEVPALYAQHDAFLLPTRGEGWGLPLMEAMSMALPAVGTDWGGSTEFMKRKPPNSDEWEYFALGIHNEGLEEAEKKMSVKPSDWLRLAATISPVDWDRHTLFSPRHFWRSKLENMYEDNNYEKGSLNEREVVERVAGRRGYCRPEVYTNPPRKGCWANPSVEHMSMHIRWLYTHKKEGKNIGAKARRYIVEKYSRDKVAEVIAKRTGEIAAKEARKRARHL
eukprot:Tbor_TRINITY_DN3675_c0_g1::TRINITY_DN3675_c0_g1_i1::g.231::m.231